MPPLFTVIAVVVGVVAVIYGLLRKFSRQTWIGWQAVIITAALPFFRYFTSPEGGADGKTYAIQMLAGLFVLVSVVLIVGRIVRLANEKRKIAGKKNGFLSFCDSILGVVTFALNLVAFALAVGGFALLVVNNFSGDLGMQLNEMLAPVYTFAVGDFVVWEFAKNYILDFSTVYFLLFLIKGAYRLGLIKGIWTILSVAAGIAAFVGSFYMSFNVGFMVDWVNGLTERFAHLGEFLAKAAALGAVAGGTFLVLLILLLIVNLLLGKMFRRMDDCRPVRFIDGAILTVLAFALFMAVHLAFLYGVSYILTVEFGEPVVSYLDMIDLEGIFTSSFFNGTLYKYNLLAFFIG